MKKTQRKFVIDKLLTDGFISRNYCLKNYISRLSAIILNLKEEGWEIEGKWVDNDFYYDVKGSPLKKVVYIVPELNKEITLFQ